MCQSLLMRWLETLLSAGAWPIFSCRFGSNEDHLSRPNVFRAYRKHKFVGCMFDQLAMLRAGKGASKSARFTNRPAPVLQPHHKATAPSQAKMSAARSSC